MNAFVQMVENLKKQGYDQSAAESQASLMMMDQELSQGQQPGPQGTQMAPEAVPAPTVDQPMDQGYAPSQAPTEAPAVPVEEQGYTPAPTTQGYNAVPEVSEYKYVNEGATDSRALGESLLAFGLKTLAIAANPNTQNWAQALVGGMEAGNNAFFNALNRNKRFENIGELERMGYNKLSIDEYIRSGDNKVLSKDPMPKMEWRKAPSADGIVREQLMNSDTGEPVIRGGQPVFRDVANIADTVAEGTWINLGNGMVMNNKTQEVRRVDGGQGQGSAQNGTVSYAGEQYGVGVHAVPQEDGSFKYIEVAQSTNGKLSVKPSTEKKYNDYSGVTDTSAEWSEGETLDSDKMSKMKLNEGQAKNVQHVRNGAEALDEYEYAMFGTDPSAMKAYIEKGVLPNWAKDSDRQLAEVAGDRLLMTVLRPESGAAIPEEEMERYRRTYLPQPGDSERVVESKMKSLRTRLNGLADGSGPAAKFARSHLDTSFNRIDERKKAVQVQKEEATKKAAEAKAKAQSAKPQAPANVPTQRVTRTFGGKTYTLKPGADPRKQSSWEVQ